MERSCDVTTAVRDGPAQWAAPGQNALGRRLNDMRTLTVSSQPCCYVIHCLQTDTTEERMLRKPKFRYRIHNSSPAVTIRSQSKPVHASPTHFFKIHCNIIFPSMPRSSTRSLSIRPPHQNPVCASHVSHLCHMPSPSHSSWCLKT